MVTRLVGRAARLKAHIRALEPQYALDRGPSWPWQTVTKRCECVPWIGDSRVGACAPIMVRAHTMEDRRGRSVCSLRCVPVDCTLPRLVSTVVRVREGSHPECETHLHTIDVM